MPDSYGTDTFPAEHGKVESLAPQVDLLLEGPFSIQEGYLHWIKGGRDVPVEYEGREVLVPAPFSPTGVTIEMFEKRVQREIKQT